MVLKTPSAPSKASKSDRSQIDPGALEIVRALRARGHRALLAGGCVRDWLLGRNAADWDIATDAQPEMVVEYFDRTIEVGKQFGVVVVVLEQGQYEVARFRRDGPYRDGRHPAQVEPGEVHEDAARRDFTINGLFYDPIENELLDHVGGQADIGRRLVRSIGDPGERLREDYLRMLRAVRFASKLGFDIHEDTFAAICGMAPQIARISSERVRDELSEILTAENPGRGLSLLFESGLLHEVLPEVEAMDGVAQPPEYHPEGDVFTHVKLMLDLASKPDVTLAWGILLHDVGKPPTCTLSDRIRFNGHDAVGARMAAEICARLRLSNTVSRGIVDLVAHHMRIGAAKEMRESKLKRLLREPFFAALLELHRLDCLASHRKLDLFEFCRERLRSIPDEVLKPKALVTGDGLIVMGYDPGPAFKVILSRVEEEQLEGRISTKEEAEQFVRGEFPRTADS
jgi:poly(A) polymerase